MREIQFRGRWIGRDAWIYGGFHSRFGRSFIIGIAKSGIAKSIRIDGGEVFPETVGQYTGLTDKNGEKIFEGDILMSDNEISSKGVVEYADGAFGVRFADGTGQFLCFYEDAQIIGNIHDNPELLKGGDYNVETFSSSQEPIQ